jgi:hypothetical protein
MDIMLKINDKKVAYISNENKQVQEEIKPYYNLIFEKYN